MKLISAVSVFVVAVIAAHLLRYDITPAAVPLAGGRDVAVCVRLDRWTGKVMLGRQMCVGSENGPQMVGWIWEPIGTDLETLAKSYRDNLTAR